MTAALFSTIIRLSLIFIAVALLSYATTSPAAAHPLGNFTINHFTRIDAGRQQVRLHYVIDMAEIPAFQATQSMAKNSDGSLSQADLNVYLGHVASCYAAGLLVTVNGKTIPLQIVSKTLSMPRGSGGLYTLRVECDFAGDISATDEGSNRRFHFEDRNNPERIGWHEIVVTASSAKIFNSSAFGSQVTDELKAYPEDMLTVPLDERVADFSWTTESIPADAVALRTRDGRTAEASRDRFAELINVPVLTPLNALLGLLIAAGLGALHAFSPGHGKTVVGAYLVGSKGTARHAAFLGLTVTITHTAGVFALGMITLFASQYIVPERIFPVLSFVSGAIVLFIGLSLFIRRLRVALRAGANTHAQGTHHGAASHSHDHGGDASFTHSHGGVEHSHLPPGADGSAVTWRSLLALGISGGLLPCPSALVVLLSAIALHRVGYGLLLVVAFSAGLAATLTAIGLMFVFAGRFFKRPAGQSPILRLLPAFSALVIACVGAAICYEALGQSGVNLSGLLGNWSASRGAASTNVTAGPGLTSLGAFAVLGLGLMFGLKHATEVDHIVAVSTIVSEHRNLFRAALVGAIWGMGHTVSLIAVGLVVLVLRIAIPEYVSSWLEFGVALMIIGLGVNALVRALRRRPDTHLHRHTHGRIAHEHLHFHESAKEHSGIHNKEQSGKHSHAVSRVGFKPLLVGAMHGLAGSGALTVLVLTQIPSVTLGLFYLAVFGIGSIFGMLLMSFLVGLPFALSSRRLGRVHYGLQTFAGALSVAFGFWYAYETGIASGLLTITL
jgi:ABC-type nickel/cobalt efflux system permease component RcnA